MKKILFTIALVAITIASCKQTPRQETTDSKTTETENPVVVKDTTKFAERALSQDFLNEEGNTLTLEQILAKYKGKTILIDVWAAWCPDCIKALPGIKAIKEANPETVFVNLSLDKTEDSWKEALTKYNVEGENYFSKEGEGMKGDFGKSLDLNWIPRYIVVDKESNIALYNATEKNFEEIKKLLKKLQE
ncbi:TlpA family protein disulfide reductase [Myroides pelagicus]|uniref:Redoxin family protein n=1 Tax=Myroides pelagicus TaxID=270914 RepID=A0A7K1GQ36_9FLAO|nr:TlpA family protein disulfide reductase [Myroides pelagicus]MEC4113842.1 TlpA family protein disulfide reductase [Myroides pelagicus]MTH30659.1 redoxin family protein [Myroides pelagicus]